jgi:hypothetical protein
MITRDVAEPARDTIDFTMMYATHDAFLRDLGRLEEASAAGKAGTAGVRAGWENFRTQLLLHHSVEDSHLWPAVRRAVPGRPRDLALLGEMEAEHARLDPLLAAFDEALTVGQDDLARQARELSAALGEHLAHEEQEGLPLIQAVLTPADWRAFAGQMRRRQGVRGAAVYVPWILDGAPRVQQCRFLAALPAPVRLINRLLWEPRYRRRKLWNY